MLIGTAGYYISSTAVDEMIYCLLFCGQLQLKGVLTLTAGRQFLFHTKHLGSQLGRTPEIELWLWLWLWWRTNRRSDVLESRARFSCVFFVKCELDV